MSLTVLQRFHMVVNLHRDDPGHARNVAADHQHHAELAHRMRKGEDRGGKITRQRQGDSHGKEGVEPGSAQCRRHFQRPVTNRLKGVLQRLHHERQGIKHRGDHQPLKGERQGTDAECLGQMANRPVRPHGQQQVEAEDRGRQHQRQGNHGPNHPFPSGVGT